MPTPTYATEVHSTTGLKGVKLAPLTADESTGTTYGTVVNFVGAIDVEFAPDTAEPDEQWYDDHLGDVITKPRRGTLTMNMADIPPEMRALINNHKTDNYGVVVENDGDEVKYFAIGYQSEKMNGANRFEWLYKAYAELIGSKGNTVDKDGRKPQTTQVKWHYVPRISDGNYHVFVDDDNAAFATKKSTFFATVYEPDFTPPSP